MESEAPRKDRLIVAGIDFGTTFSGYAFSVWADYEKNPEKIEVNQNWIAGILLGQDKKVMAFGYEAEDRYNQLVEVHVLSRETMIEDETGKKLPAMLVISLSIKYMKDHLLTLINKRCIGVEEDDIHWVITIPAIWDDSAKQMMREAAVNVQLYEEGTSTEAGAKEKSLIPSRAGTKYMILDLGGGTADITVHECQVDGRLKEIHEPSGGPGEAQLSTGNSSNFVRKHLDISVENFKRVKLTDFQRF